MAAHNDFGKESEQEAVIYLENMNTPFWNAIISIKVQR